MPRWSRPPAPQTNWFAIATAIAAIAVVFCGGGLGESEPIVGQMEPLTLTLSAPQICETTPARGYADSVLRQDAEGNWTKRVSVFAGWFGVAEVDVAWTVSGGAAPYRLRIDGEKRDPDHEYVGATGIASVSCAMTSGAAAFIDISDRGYKAQPEVDSGVKTIVATVTDATGATAEASVDVHVILELGSSGDILQGGKTYRVFRRWLTVPEGIDLEIGDYEAGDGGTTSYELHVVGRSAEIWLDPYLHQEVFRLVPPGEEEIHAKFDELVASVGRLPSIVGYSE